MGIQNLLRFLKPLIEPVHIKKYAGKRVGIDAYSWLHKGAYSCSMELCLNKKTDNARRYLKYFMHHINLLRHHKITPVVVLDGGNIPCKSDTETGRHRRRKENLALAKEKLEEGNERAAIEYFQKAVHITPDMAHELIQILRSENVDFIVAPYEADAQLAYLSALTSEQGGIDAVITEDSDLVAYGCPAIIFKMDRYGNGEEFLMDKVFNNVTNGLSFKNFNEELFTGMCVLAGCDFLPSIIGIGPKRAHTLVSKYRNLDRVLSVLRLDKKYQVPEDYSDTFKKTLAVFHHARIYDPETKSLKMLKPLDEKHSQYLNGNYDLLGPDLPSSIAIAIAEGHLNPITMEPFNKFSTDQVAADYISLSSDKVQIISTQDSCITVFPDRSNQKITITIEEMKMDTEKYKKEAVALGKLITQKKTQKTPKQQASKMEVPNNNPFKKRKVESVTSKHEILSKSTMTVEQTVDVMCLSSSPESQVSIESKPLMRLSSKERIPKKSILKNEKSGLLKFFERL